MTTVSRDMTETRSYIGSGQRKKAGRGGESADPLHSGAKTLPRGSQGEFWRTENGTSGTWGTLGTWGGEHREHGEQEELRVELVVLVELVVPGEWYFWYFGYFGYFGCGTSGTSGTSGTTGEREEQVARGEHFFAVFLEIIYFRARTRQYCYFIKQ